MMQITSEMVLFGLTILAAIAGMWWRIEAMVGKAKSEAIDSALLASTRADLAHTQLTEFKVHVAETYVSRAGLREARDEIMGAIGHISNQMSDVSKRIDRVIDGPERNSR